MSMRARWGRRIGSAAVAVLMGTAGALAVDVATASSPASAAGGSTTTFTTNQLGGYLLPPGYSFLRVLVVGGHGGGAGPQSGGRGAAITAEIPYSAVPQGLLFFTVGADGGFGLSYTGNGFLTGGAGGSGDLGRIGAQGGAASALYTNCVGTGNCATPLVVAGGGGGRGPDTNFTPGDAGMPGGTGSSGWYNLIDPGPTGGLGGSQSAPGAGGACCVNSRGAFVTIDPQVSGAAGSSDNGGLNSAGGAGGISLPGTVSSGGGGGGGGLYPGGGGSGRNIHGSFSFEGAGGGGGSSYLHPSVTLLNAHPADALGLPGDDNGNPTPRIEITPFNAHTATTVTCVEPVRYAGGISIPCTATVTGTGFGPPTGTVSFSSLRVANGFSPMSCTLDATGSCTVIFNTPQGGFPQLQYDVNAHYPGNANYLFSDGVVFEQPVLSFLGPFTMNCTPATPTVGSPVACHLDVQEFNGQFPTSFADTATLSVTGGTGTFSAPTCTFVQTGNWEGTCDTTFTPTSSGAMTLHAVALTSAEATATLDVSSAAPTLTGVDVSPSTVQVAKGTTQQLTATAHFSDNSTQDVTTSATWSSDTPAAVTVDATGLASGVAVGSATVTASFNGQSGTATVTVTPPALTGIDVTPATATVALGATQAFQATGRYADGTTADVTATATWSSPAPSHLTVDASGVATGVSAGTSPVVATIGGISGSASLTVNQGVPGIAWSNPADITYGTALGSAQLHATATYNGQPVAGTLAYTPPAGTVLDVGAAQTLSVTFTPTDTADYTTAAKTVTINVGKATPTITWPAPASIIVDTPLTTTQLNATASVPGKFTYTPGTLALLGAGTRTLSVTFVPTDTAHYTNATATRTISVLYKGAGTSCLGSPGHAILAPVNADGTSQFKLGTTIALQFRLCDVWGLPIITNPVTGITLNATPVANGFRFDLLKLQWAMTLTTKGLTAGKYTGTITLNDGTAIPFAFTLR